MSTFSQYNQSQLNFNPANQSAFGDLEVQQMTPLFQWSFATGLRDQLGAATTANTATVDVSSGRLRLQTTANTYGSALYQSTKSVAYRPGQGVTWRGTPIWTSSNANSQQYCGIGTTVDGYFFGYKGTSFGVCHRLNSSDSDFIAQASWNQDTCLGTGPSGFTLDTTKGIPMMIKYPYLGHGNISFWILNPTTGAWILVHCIQYAGSSAVPQLTNPNLNLYAEAKNTGNANNLIMYLTCSAAFLDGPKEFLGCQYGMDSTKTGITTETNMITLKNCTSINGVTNRGLARLRSMSGVAVSAGNNLFILRIRKGATLGGTPSYSPISGIASDPGVATTLTSAQSIMSYDVAGTTVSTANGSLYFSATGSNTGSAFEMDLTAYKIYISPGETMTFSLFSTTSTSQSTMCVNWQEDVQ